MALSCVRLCTRHVSTQLQVCGYATLNKASRPREKTSSDPVFQYVGRHKKPTHKVFVWGFSFTGALGIPSFVVPDSGRKNPRKYQLTPYRLETAEQISSAACGYGFTLIASPTKDVIKLWGMGLNKDSQLGFQRTQHSRHKSYDYVLEPSPVALPLVEPLQTKVLQVACGRAHSLVLTDQEGVFSMGNNAYGQCGRRIVEDEVYSGSHIIHKIEGFSSRVTQVACGQDHSLFLSETGKVFACGWGADGQTGLGHHKISSLPTEVGGDLAGVEVQQISTYGDCSLAVSREGQLYGWGNSEYLQLASVTEATQVRRANMSSSRWKSRYKLPMQPTHRQEQYSRVDSCPLTCFGVCAELLCGCSRGTKSCLTALLVSVSTCQSCVRAVRRFNPNCSARSSHPSNTQNLMFEHFEP